MKPPYSIGSVPSLSGHAIAYRWRSLPRVRRHRASKPQGSSERVLPWQVTMDQLIFASLSHTHYWYEVGMLNVPARACICMAITCSKSMDQPGKVANPARGQLNKEINISLSAFAPESLVSRDGFGSPVPRQPAHRHTQAEPRACLRDSSRVPRRRPFMYFKPSYAIGSVPSLSGRAITCRWRSLPRVHRHRASEPQGISKRVLPWQVTMNK